MERKTLRRIYNEGYDGSLVSGAKDTKIKIDGKWLLDTCMGCGTHIFGHPKRIVFEGSPLYAHPNRLAIEAGELLKKSTGFEHFIFANSGTEATMKAIRLARSYTGRDKVAFFEGHWHGSQDYNLASYSKGIPQAVKDLVLVLPFTDKAFETIEKEKPALVMIEPVQGADPVCRVDFLKRLRNVTKRNKVLLCFDEVITGFRMALGGMSEVLGITPDLVTYGKTLGGGVPIGVIGGNEVIESNDVFMGGTFSANPLQISQCIKTLKRLIDEKPHKKLLELTGGLKSENIKVCLNMAKVQKVPERLNGVYLNKNRMILLSTKHTKKDVEFIKRAFNEKKV